jgi:hypothetical protein
MVIKLKIIVVIFIITVFFDMYSVIGKCRDVIVTSKSIPISGYSGPERVIDVVITRARIRRALYNGAKKIMTRSAYEKLVDDLKKEFGDSYQENVKEVDRILEAIKKAIKVFGDGRGTAVKTN